MQKMYYELDKEKVLRDGIYDYEDMVRLVNEICVKYGAKLDDDGFWIVDYVSFGVILLKLEKMDWFMDNVKTWICYEHYELRDYYAPTDLIDGHNRRYGKGKYAVS